MAERINPLFRRIPNDRLKSLQGSFKKLLDLGHNCIHDLEGFKKTAKEEEVIVDAALLLEYGISSIPDLGAVVQELEKLCCISPKVVALSTAQLEISEWHEDVDKAFDGCYRIADCEVCAEMIVSEDFQPHWANNKPPPSDRILQKISSPRSLSLSPDHTVIETDQVTKGQDEAGNKMINEYTCISELGRGSYGKVKLVLHNPTGNYYAIKVMGRSMKDHGDVEEIAIMKRCNHTNICALHEVIYDLEGEKMYLIIDYFEKGAVYDMSSNSPLPLEKVRKYFVGICQGLDYLHAHKVVHRDVKPDNILVGGDDEVRLTDFGISHTINQDTEVADTRGTPAFLPPDVIRNEKIPGKMADVWALGVTMYIMSTGQLPFTGSNYKELSECIIENKPDWDSVTSTSEPLAELLKGMLEQELSKRVGFTDGVRDVLRSEFLVHEPKAEIQEHTKISITQEEKEKAILQGRNIRLNLGNTVGVMVKVRGAVQGFKGLSKGHEDFIVVTSDLSEKETQRQVEQKPAIQDVADSDTGSDSDDGVVKPPEPVGLSATSAVGKERPPSFRVQSRGNLSLTPKRSFRTEEEAVMEETNADDLIEILRSNRKMEQRELTLNCVKFKSLPAELLLCTRLEHFTAHLNGLQQLPANINKLENLVSLNIAQNDLCSLPASLSQIKTLTKLDCNHNKIEFLPDTYAHMSQLRSIILDYNNLAEVPACLCHIVKLEKCFMANNERITHIPYGGKNWESCQVCVTNTPQLMASWAMDKKNYPNITMLWNKLYPDQVTETVFLGSLRTAQSEQVFSSLNITKIVTAGKGLLVLNPLPSTVQQITLNIDDNPDQKLTPFFDDVSAYIEEARVANEKVLVHCFAGLSRSVAVACAYLMKTKAMTFKESITLIKGARPSANPNDGFRKQLIQYEFDLYGTRLAPDDVENHSNGPTVEPEVVK